MKKIVFFLVIHVFCSSCTESTTSVCESCIEIIINENDFQTINFSTLVNPPKVIILENKEEALIGKPTDIQIFDGLIFELDAFGARGLFVFNMDGKFIRRIGSLGRGPGEYASISDFTIDQIRKELYILGDQRIFKYSIDGAFIESLNVLSLNCNLYRIQYYDNYIYADVKGNHLSNDNEMLLKIDISTGKIIEKYFKSTEFNCGWDLPFSADGCSFKYRMNDPPLYSQTFMNRIISLKDMEARIVIKNDRYAPTAEDIDNLRKERTKTGIISLLDFPKMHSIHNYMEGNSFIFFNFRSNSRLFGVLYDTKQNVFTVGFLKNDLIFKDSYFGTSIMFSDNNGAYSIISPDAMYYFLDALKKNEVVENLDKVDQLHKLDEESNPVIFYYKYKDAE